MWGFTVEDQAVEDQAASCNSPGDTNTSTAICNAGVVTRWIAGSQKLRKNSVNYGTPDKPCGADFGLNGAIEKIGGETKFKHKS